ncbi:MAG: TIR domain-containing protein [Bacteroidetes bacterium]|nr:TIR domain-containing protein [Bacteroidota bacterium]
MTNIAEATSRIEEALKKGSNRLDLSQLELNALPKNFEQLAPQLTVLNLWNNKFQSVPRELEFCTNLESLFFSQNELMSGFGLDFFRKLTLLDLQGNRFVQFPPEILELLSLQTLFLNKNNIARLPAGIRLLKELEHLELNDCQLETLPPEIAELPRLKKIQLQNNPLKSPPVEIAAQGVGAIRAYFDDLTKNVQRAESQKYLLPIAIEKYLDEFHYPTRPGAVQECDELAQVLTQKYDYQVVRNLYDAAATREAIFEALDELCKNTRPEDCVIVYFSGWTGDGLPDGDLRSYDNVYIALPDVLAKFSSMKAKHALLIVDNHLQSRQFNRSRGINFDRASFPSRWALYRRGADWEERFTPRLRKFLKDSTLSEINVRELASVLNGVLASSLAIPGDEGGEFLLEPKVESNVGVPTKAPEAARDNLGEDKEFIFQIFINEQKGKVAQNLTFEVLEEMRKYIQPNSKFKDEVFLQSRLLSDMNVKFNNDLVHPDNYNRTVNRIKNETIRLLDALNSSDLYLNDFSLQPNTKTRSEAEKEALDDILQSIASIETLRKTYLAETSLEKKRALESELQSSVAQLEENQQVFVQKFGSGDGPKMTSVTAASQLLAEENLWKKTLLENTILAFETYLKETTSGTYNGEAERRISDLRLLEQEEALFKNIQATPNVSSIQSYLTTFPNGRFRDAVQNIQTGLESDEQALWNAAQTANTLAAFQEYQAKTVLGTYREAAISRIAQLEKEGTATRINEAKLIFVGNGRVGKTSLSKVLAGEAFDPAENSTHGVRIKSWPVQLPDGREVKLNVWDFGGQEVYHNTHRFFLTTRALYMLVWDRNTQEDALEHPDRDDRERNFTHEYWLQNVQLLSAGSPVLMVQNKVEQGREPLNQKDFVPKYNVREFVEVSAAKGTDLNRLQEKLLDQFQSAPGLKDLIGYDMPENWVAVRRELESLAPTQPYIKYDTYLSICRKHQLSANAPEQLSTFLTEIGVLLHFPQHRTLREMVILNPVWATEIIYRVLNKEVEKNGGAFSDQQLRDEWSDHIPQQFDAELRFRNDQEVDIFLELMRNFEICFAVPEHPGHFIAPQFLPDKQPDGFVWDQPHAFRFGFEYPFLHRGIIARAIVRLSEYAPKGMYWRSGILIEKSGNQALIYADYNKKQIRIEATGNKTEGLCEFVIDEVFEAVNRDMVARSILFCPECDGTLDRAAVEKLKSKGEEKAFCAGCNTQVPISQICRSGKNETMPKIFISYAHEDRDHKNDLFKWLNALNWKDKVDIWEDEQMGAGADLDKTVKQHLAEADIIILLVSIDFLNSKYIKEVEFARAKERHDKNEALIIPVIVRDCIWNMTPIGKLLCLPHDGTPVEDYPKRDTAWKEVIVKISEQLRDKFGWGKE